MHELRQMRTQGSGAIVDSLGGLVGQAGRASYATKHGVIGLTKSAATDHAPRGIRTKRCLPEADQYAMTCDMIENQPEAMKEFMRDQPIGRDEVMALQPWRQLRARRRAASRRRLRRALRAR